jgi:hypothetical protein
LKFSTDPFLDRVPTPEYNCMDFVREVGEKLFDGDTRTRLDQLCEGVHADNGHIVLGPVKGFVKLDKPESPCFVVMRRTKLSPHIGIFYNGRILHMKDDGVEFQPLRVARRYFTKIGFYK